MMFDQLAKQVIAALAGSGEGSSQLVSGVINCWAVAASWVDCLA